MKLLAKAVVGLYIFNALLWSYLAVGIMAWELQSGELYYGALAESARAAREAGIRTETLTQPAFMMLVSRYGVTNRGFILNQVHVETLSGFLEAARPGGVVYVHGGVLLALGREDLLEWSPVIRGRLWPYTVEWVNK